jgi:hypothetical protein
MAADKEDLLARMKEGRQANQELLTRMDAYHEKRMAMLDDNQKRVMAKKKIEQNPEMMQSVQEHQDVPSEDVVVRPIKGLKKGRRSGKSAAGQRGEPKELVRGNCRSRRKLAAACRKVSRRATVARHKRNAFRKIRTEENCGPRSTLAAAGRRMTAGVHHKSSPQEFITRVRHSSLLRSSSGVVYARRSDWFM